MNCSRGERSGLRRAWTVRAAAITGALLALLITAPVQRIRPEPAAFAAGNESALPQAGGVWRLTGSRTVNGSAVERRDPRRMADFQSPDGSASMIERRGDCQFAAQFEWTKAPPTIVPNDPRQPLAVNVAISQTSTREIARSCSTFDVYIEVFLADADLTTQRIDNPGPDANRFLNASFRQGSARVEASGSRVALPAWSVWSGSGYG